MRWGPGLRGSRGPREGDLCKDGCRAMGECLKTRAGEVLGQAGSPRQVLREKGHSIPIDGQTFLSKDLV